MKKKRQLAILKLIETENIVTQEELSERLIQQGFRVTQATVSRDIKELKLLKVPSDQTGTKYGYLFPAGSSSSEPVHTKRLHNIIGEAVVSCDYANNIVIIKTLQGMAQGIAFAIDNLTDANIMGTIAGDDTLMVVTKTEAAAERFVEQIIKLL